MCTGYQHLMNPSIEVQVIKLGETICLYWVSAPYVFRERSKDRFIPNKSYNHNIELLTDFSKKFEYL